MGSFRPYFSIDVSNFLQNRNYDFGLSHKMRFDFVIISQTKITLKFKFIECD